MPPRKEHERASPWTRPAPGYLTGALFGTCGEPSNPTHAHRLDPVTTARPTGGGKSHRLQGWCTDRACIGELRDQRVAGVQARLDAEGFGFEVWVAVSHAMPIAVSVQARKSSAGRPVMTEPR